MEAVSGASLYLRCAEQWAGGLFDGMEIQGDVLTLSEGTFSGTVCLPPVDSGESGFRWTRLRILAELPGESGLRVYARASDDRQWPEWGHIRGAEGVREAFGPPAGSGTDLLLNRTGRYLWLALEVRAGGADRPRVDALAVQMAGDHMMDYLPAIYQEQDFTRRFLSIFNSLFQDMEEAVETLPRLLDPDAAPPEMVEYMAGWLGMEAEFREGGLRKRIPRVLAEYETLYTPEGICRSVERLTGRRPLLIEHFSVNPNDPECRNGALYRRLYGEDPYRFFLLLPHDTFRSQRDMERFLDRMRDLIPAETEAELVLLKPCVRLDWHTYLGINSQISSYVPAAIDENGTIQYDTAVGFR